MTPVIGAMCLVYDRNDKIVALECAKGRGFILPGGKVEPGETFRKAALRELREETGLIGVETKLLFHGMNADGIYGYTFRVHVKDFSTQKDSAEGRVCRVDWAQLMSSKFAAYYELLKESCNL